MAVPLCSTGVATEELMCMSSVALLPPAAINCGLANPLAPSTPDAIVHAENVDCDTLLNCPGVPPLPFTQNTLLFSVSVVLPESEMAKCDPPVEVLERSFAKI